MSLFYNYFNIFSLFDTPIFSPSLFRQSPLQNSQKIQHAVSRSQICEFSPFYNHLTISDLQNTPFLNRLYTGSFSCLGHFTSPFSIVGRTV